jgi:hypothetical protein
MALTHQDRAAITFDALLSFIAQAELGNARHDTHRLGVLLEEAVAVAQREAKGPSGPVDRQYQMLLTTALRFVRELEKEEREGVR